MRRKKIMLFAYDGTGLGHLMRLIKISSGFSEAYTILIVSGHKALPELVRPGVDYCLLQNFYEERDKGKSNAEVNGKRIIALRNLVLSYKPDAFITDYLPLGKRLELYSIISGYNCRKYFILRSEIGGDTLARNDVFSERNNAFLGRNYDKIFVASDPMVTTPSSFSWLPKSIRIKMVYSGFVTYPVTNDEVEQTRLEWHNDNYKKWVICSDGGGRKGADLIEECIRLSQEKKFEDFQFDIVLGYYSPLLEDIPVPLNHNIRIIKWTNILYKLHASADYVICSGAYNSLLESMQGRPKTIISMSVLDNTEDNEQVQNIEKLSLYYDIRKLDKLSELKSVFEQVVTDKSHLTTDMRLDMNGISNVCKEIEFDLEMIC